VKAASTTRRHRARIEAEKEVLGKRRNGSAGGKRKDLLEQKKKELPFRLGSNREEGRRSQRVGNGPFSKYFLCKDLDTGKKKGDHLWRKG